MARCSLPENYYSSGRNTELKLCRLWSIYRRGNRQTKKSGFSTVWNDHNASDSNPLFLCLLLSVLPYIKMRLWPSGSQVYVAWKRKMLHDVIGGHQAYIQREIYLWSLQFRSWLRPHAISKLCSRFACDKIIKSPLGTNNIVEKGKNLKKHQSTILGGNPKLPVDMY